MTLDLCTEQAGGRRLEGKIALITGGCSGMGLATVQRFLAEGAQVVIADIQVERGQVLAKQAPDRLAFARCDVTNEEQIAAAIGLAESRFGGLDIMFNNAGAVGDPSALDAITVEGWDRTLALLLRSTMLGIKHAVPSMRARGGGAIINTASIAGLQAGRSAPAYSVAKAGVVQLTRMAAAEFAKDNIRVNAICPGFIVTSIFGNLLHETQEVSDSMLPHLAGPFGELQPMKRAGMPRDVADACLFLASNESVFVTDTEIVVDGGLMVETRLVVNPETGEGFMDMLADAQRQART